MPEIGGRLHKLDADLGQSTIRRAEPGDPAFGFRVGLQIHQGKRLPEFDLRRQHHQGAVGAHRNSKGLLLKRRVAGRFPSDKQWDIQQKTFAGSAFYAPAYLHCFLFGHRRLVVRIVWILGEHAPFYSENDHPPQQDFP